MKKTNNRDCLCNAIVGLCRRRAKKLPKKKNQFPNFTGAAGEVKLMTLDPGHFHSSLVQKSMYGQIDPTVYVYAPEGPDVKEHLSRVEAFNKRAESPTTWVEKVYTGPDYFEKMLAEKTGQCNDGSRE